MKKLKRVLRFFLWVSIIALTMGFKEVTAIVGDKTAIYTVSDDEYNNKYVTTSGDIPADSTSEIYLPNHNAYITNINSDTYYVKMCKDSVMRLELKGYQDCKITNVKLHMRSDANSGTGGLTISVGSTQIYSLVNYPFDSSEWNGAFSTEYVDINKNISTDHITSKSDLISVKIDCNKNYLYCDRISITYTVNTRTELSPITGFTLSGNTVTITEVPNASAYVIGLFLSEESTIPACKVESETNSVYIINVPQGIEYIIKVYAKGNNEYYDTDYFSTETPTRFTNTIVPEYTFEEVRYNTSCVNAFFTVTGYIKSISADNENPTFNMVSDMNSINELIVEDIANFDSYGFLVGEKVTIKAYKFATCLRGTTVINHFINYAKRFTNLNTVASLNASYSYTTNHLEEWVKVTDASTLQANDQLVIVSGNYVAGDMNENVLSPVAVTFTDDKITTLPSDATILTLGEINGVWILSNSGKPLGVTELGMLSWGLGNIIWVISIEGNEATISSADSALGTLTYNDTNSHFTTYKPSQTPITIYKKVISDTNDYSINKDDNEKPQISMMFGGIIDKTMYDELAKKEGTKYGILYSTTTNLGVNTLQSLIDSVNTNSITFANLLETNHLSNMDLTNIMTLVNTSGELDLNGTQYQLGVELKNINESKFDVEVTAACYVYYDGTYYLMNPKSYSVNSIAATYFNALDTSAYTQHLEMLSWLKNYKAN